jgi:integrase/recombinase XerC
VGTGVDAVAGLAGVRRTASHHNPTSHVSPEAVVADALAHADRRVELMILLAARQGLRRGEIALVHSRDVSADLCGWSLRVHGKGARERVIPLHDDIAHRLRALDDGWAFPGQIDGHLSPRWVGHLIRDALLGDWTAHTLRHRFATVAYSGGRDLVAVQELLGHSRPETTRQYIRLPDDAMRAAIVFAA